MHNDRAQPPVGAPNARLVGLPRYAVFCGDRARVHVCRDRDDPAGVPVPRPPGLWHGYRAVQHHPLHRGRQPALGTASARITEVALGMERPPISVHCAVHGVVPNPGAHIRGW